MSAKKRPKELEYIGKVPKPGDSVWTIENGYALEHIITSVYSPEGFFSCSVRYPNEKESFRMFDAADMYICRHWFLNREDAENALDRIEQSRAKHDSPKNMVCARPRNRWCYRCPYSYTTEDFDVVCRIAEGKWKFRPKKPIYQDNTSDCTHTAPYCPECGHILIDGNGDNFNFCPDCGQKIDWGE